MGTKAILKFYTFGGMALTLAMVMFTSSFGAPNLHWSFLYGFMGSSCSLLALLAFDIALHHPADSHTLHSVLHVYKINRIYTFLGKMNYQALIDKYNSSTTDVQKSTLSQILKLQSGTEYGQRYNFAAIENREQYRKMVPLATFENFSHYIDRIANSGEDNLLTSQKINGLSTSSGTTGKSKYIPFITPNPSARFAQITIQLYLTELKTGALTLGKVFSARYRPKVGCSRSGLEIAPITYHIWKDDNPLGLGETTPPEIWRVEDERLGFYICAVFSLVEREVNVFNCGMSTIGYSFWKFVESQWPEICDDIEAGKLQHLPDLETDLRLIFEKKLKPNPRRAEELRVEFGRGMEGLCLRIWPGCYYSNMLKTGGFAQHAKLLAEGALKGVCLVSGLHASSEGTVGMSMGSSPADISYCLQIAGFFFEFIPEVHCGETNPATLFADQVEVGKKYELVLTTMTGFYRYRLGDVIKIVGRIGQAPQYEFQYRLGQLLNLYWEKTPESAFYSALTKTTNDLGLILSDYSACEDIYVKDLLESRECLKHYVLFLEIDKPLDEKAHELFDDNLRREFEIYDDLRTKQSIGPMRVCPVKKGTFLKLKRMFIRDSENQQYKTPRVLRKQEGLTLLVDNLVIKN